MNMRWMLLVACASLMNSAYAKEQDWKSNIELGYVQTGGNTQTKTVHSKLKSVLEAETFRTTLEGAILNASDQVKTTAEKYAASLQEDWKFSEKSYVLARLAFDSDRFAGVKSRYVEMLGYGRTLLDDDIWHANMEIGGGARQTQLLPYQRKNDAIARASTDWKWFITEYSTLTQKINTEGGKEGFLSHSVTSLQQKINKTLSSKISFSAEHTSKVPLGVKKLNTEISVTLVLAY